MLLLVAFWAGRLQRPQLCLQSRLIESVQIPLSPAGEPQALITVHSCISEIENPDLWTLKKPLRQINERLGRLETFISLHFKRLKWSSTRVVIDKSDDHEVRFRSPELALGSSALSAPGALEKAILGLVLDRNFEQPIPGIVKQTLADFLFAVMNGVPGGQDSVSGRGLNFSQVHWPDELTSMIKFCESPWRPSDMGSFCQAAQKNSNVLRTLETVTHPEKVFIWSLRGPFGKSIWDHYSSLSLWERAGFVSEMIERLRVHRWEPFDQLFFSSVQDAQQALYHLVAQTSPTSIDSAVALTTPATVVVDLRKDSPALLSASAPMVVLLTPRWPSLKTISKLKSKRVVVFRVADTAVITPKDRALILGAGWQKFASRNPEFDFIAYNTESARLLLSRAPRFNIVQLGQSSDSRGQLLQPWFDFQVKNDIPFPGASKLIAPLAAVEYFRCPEGCELRLKN